MGVRPLFLGYGNFLTPSIHTLMNKVYLSKEHYEIKLL